MKVFRKMRCALLVFLGLLTVAPVRSFGQVDTTNVWFSNGPEGLDAVLDLAIDPQFPGTLFAATRPGPVYRSLNHGAVWDSVGSVLADSVLSVAIAPSNTAVVYAGTGNGGVYRSADSGANWAFAGLPGGQVTVLAVDPTDENRVFAGTPFTLHRSSDGGGIWIVVNPSTKAVDITALAINPLMPDTVYAGTDALGVFRSRNGGGDLDPDQCRTCEP